MKAARSSAWVWMALGIASVVHAQSSTSPVEAAHEPLTFAQPIQDKNFYLLSVLDSAPVMRAAVHADPTLASLAARQQRALTNALETCDKKNPSCLSGGFRWPDSSIATAQRALVGLYHNNRGVASFVDGPLRRSGMFEFYHDQPGDTLLSWAWRDAAAGMNRIIDEYGKEIADGGMGIDSAMGRMRPESYGEFMAFLLDIAHQRSTPNDLFFHPALDGAIGLLELNQRDEAGRLEPLHLGENAAAIKRVRSIAWHKFPYSVIIVPGEGPGVRSISLDPLGWVRIAYAAIRYREGKAPFILVSGGYVHPERTHFSEAIEMKRALMQEFGVPENAILVDPYARHTTTNIRNAAREVYRYGIPFDKPALVTAEKGDVDYIESDGFAKRCLGVFHYVPYQVLRRTSPNDLELSLRADALQADASDPLDP